MDADGAPISITDWESRFSEVGHDEWFFGKDASELGRLTLSMWRMCYGERTGRVLDLGCGEGRDAVYFAMAGFDVTVIDGSVTALAKAVRLADERHTRLARTLCGDVRTAPLDEGFDICFSGNCLQMLGSDCPTFLARVQATTRPGGLNGVRVATDATDTFAERPGFYRFAHDELRRRYDGWQLLYYSEDLLWVKHLDGLASFAGVIARKPE